MGRISVGNARRAFYRAQGRCPGCRQPYIGARLFCFTCRLAQSLRASAWYWRNRDRALATKRARECRT